MTRVLSHTELSALTRCESRWDFAYGGALAGSALKPKIIAPRLREGRAWGRAVATWHEYGEIALAASALIESVEADAQEQIAYGTYDAGETAAMLERLDAILRHYCATVARLNMGDPEYAFRVPVMDGFEFEGYLDGIHRDAFGRPWIVEFKLRDSLTSFEQLALDRQGRRYAWAWRQQHGEDVCGVIYDERLNEAPRPPKLLKSGKPSADKRQFVTPDDYRAACAAAGVEPDEETVAAFAARKWHNRQVVIFRPGELDEAGAEVASLARRITDLEQNHRLPVREPHRGICGGCPFSGICPNPSDAETVDALFVRQPPKRDRKEAASAA